MATEIPWGWAWVLVMVLQTLMGSMALFSGRLTGWKQLGVAILAFCLGVLGTILSAMGDNLGWLVHVLMAGLGTAAAVGCAVMIWRPGHSKDAQALRDLREQHAQRRLLQNGITLVRQNVEMREAIRASKRRNLRSQMNPHFLFNVLTGVQHLLIRDQREKALHIFGRFRHLLMQSFEVQHKVVGSVAEELQHVRQYIELELQRVTGPFEWTISCADNVDIHRTPCPLLVLQPLVENAIWHGLHGGRMRDGRIHISVSWSGHDLAMTVADNGQPLHDECGDGEAAKPWGKWSDGRQKKEFKRDPKHESRALSILKERLALFRHQGTFRLLETPEGHPFHSGMSAQIHLPFWRLQDLEEWREKEQHELAWLNSLKPEVQARYEALNREAQAAAREVEAQIKKDLARNKRAAS